MVEAIPDNRSAFLMPQQAQREPRNGQFLREHNYPPNHLQGSLSAFSMLSAVPQIEQKLNKVPLAYPNLQERPVDLSRSMAPQPPSAQYQFVYNYGDPTDPEPTFEPQDIMGFTPLPLPPSDFLETQSNNCFMPLRRSRSQNEMNSDLRSIAAESQYDDLEVLEVDSDPQSKVSINFPMAASPLLPVSGARFGRERAVSQAVSNFDLFQLEGNHSPNMKVESVVVVRGRWQRSNTIIEGVRYYEIKTVIRQMGAAHQNQLDSPIIHDCKVVFRRYSDFKTLHMELIDQNLVRFIPAIPAKSLQDRIAEDDSTFVLDRIKQLQTFIEEVLADKQLGQSGILLKFLTFNERQFELLKTQMLQSQDKRTSLPVEPAPDQTQSRFSSWMSSYLYMPLSGTPTTLVPQMLDTQYSREVINKLAELKSAIEAILGNMRRQGELLSKKKIDVQDKIDRSLASLQQLAKVSVSLGDSHDLFDSDVQSLDLDTSQEFEKLPQGEASQVKAKTAIRSQTLSQARVYEAQAVRAETLIRLIESAQTTVDRRSSYILKYKKLSQVKMRRCGRKDGNREERQMEELKEMILSCTKGHIGYVDVLELQVNQWLFESLQRIAVSEQKSCRLLLDNQADEPRSAAQPNARNMDSVDEIQCFVDHDQAVASPNRQNWSFDR